jgi:nitrate reductase gamma subunit
VIEEPIAAGVGLSGAQIEEMYRIMAIANYEDRFVIPSGHREDAEDMYDERGGCGFSFGNGCSGEHRKPTCSAPRPARNCKPRRRCFDAPYAPHPVACAALSTQELQQAAPELLAMLELDGVLEGGQIEKLNPLVEALIEEELLDLQERYVGLFDRGRAVSLHLFEHVHGESRDRGQAMVDLRNRYEAQGLEITANELPDYLPMFLEYLFAFPRNRYSGTCQPGIILHALAERLVERDTPYAGAMQVLAGLAGAGASFAIAPADNPDDLAALDAAWAEEQVRFDTPAPADAGKPAQKRRPCSPACGQPMRRGARPMADFIHHLLFGIYPYVALSVLIVGSVIRYDREPYSWRAGSSQLLRRKQLIVGSVLFHLGVLMIFAGHLVGLLPIAIWDALGVPHGAKQVLAMSAGGIAGLMAITGASLLIHRRFFDPRVRAASNFSDNMVILLLWLQLALGLSTIPVSAQHLDGHEMVKFMEWAQGIFTFRGAAADQIRDVAPVFKLHLMLGMTILLLFPFTRLVHMLSMPVRYIWRSGYQVVRSRKLVTRHG